MSDVALMPHSALGGVSFDGFATVREVGPLGMISLRCAPDAAALPEALRTATGLGLPERRRILTEDDRSVGWMSPDEWLLILPYPQVPQLLAHLSRDLGTAALAVDVSDARAVFRIEGPRATEVLAKLCPVDFATLPQGELRRTRAAQVAAALWRDGDGFTLVCFRSVARYVFDLLVNAAQ